MAVAIETPPKPPARPAALVAGLVLAGLVIWRLTHTAPAPDAGPRVTEYSGDTMGTFYHVRVAFGPGEAVDDTSIVKAIEGALDGVDQAMSTYKPDSELSRFNQHRESAPFTVSPDTLKVFQCARQISEESGGAFDVTVGPLVNAWGFGPENPLGHAPSEEELAQLRERVGYEKVTINEAASTLTKTHPDVYCDLSAIAKGYGVDKTAEALDALGIENYMVEVGGEVRARGHNERGVPWNIGVQRPDSALGATADVIHLSGKSMATSGDYRHYYEDKQGNRLSHTIDPKTGRPIAHKLASVSVIHKECMWADGYATAINVLGPDEGLDFANRLGLPAYLLVRTADGGFIEQRSAAWNAAAGEVQQDGPGALDKMKD